MTAKTTIRWDEPILRIDWLISEPILSERDRNAAYIKDR